MIDRLPKIAWGTGLVNTLNLMIDTPLAYPAPRAGSAWLAGEDGSEDGITYGTDQYLSAVARWIGSADVTAPVALSGWDGAYGWNSFLRWAWQKNPFSWYADRALLFSSLTVGDAAWTNVGGATRTQGALTQNGVPLDLIIDTSTGAQQFYRYTPFPTFSAATSTKIFTWWCAVGTAQAAGGWRVQLQDSTAGAARLQLVITWSSGVPVPSVLNGTLLSMVAVGGGVYQFTCAATGVIAANAHYFQILPASNTADMGNVYVGYVQAWDDGIVRPLNPAGMPVAQSCFLDTPTTLSDMQNMTVEDDGSFALPFIIRAADDTPFRGY